MKRDKGKKFLASAVHTSFPTTTVSPETFSPPKKKTRLEDAPIIVDNTPSPPVVITPVDGSKGTPDKTILDRVYRPQVYIVI